MPPFVLALSAMVVAMAGVLLGPVTVAFAGLMGRLDGLSGLMVVLVLIAALPALLAGARGALFATAFAVLATLGAGVVAVLALGGLCLALPVRDRSTAGWALCAALALAMPSAGGVAVALAGLGLGALWVGGGQPMLGVLGVYALARVALAGALPVPCGLFVLGVGLFGAVLGGVRAARAGDLGGATPGFGAVAAGLATAGLGVAMAASGADLPEAAALGLEAASIGLLVQVAAVASLELAAAALPGAPGGLWRSMPVTAFAALVAAAGLAAAPPSGGFTSFYLLLQALFAAHRIGGLGLQFGLAVAVAATGLANGLAGMAAVRLIGLTFLGRRRGAGGLDPRGEARAGMVVLAGLGLLLAVAPIAPLLLIGPAIAQAGLPLPPTLWMPTGLAALLALGCLAGWAVLRSAPAARPVAAWEGGLEPASELGPYLPGLLAWRKRLRLRAPTLREWLAATALALAIVLIVLAAS
jgi:NADH:ubiquinone oxidoreductase subunit 5 (subunit L)/multisubunit Na+/H+ antiporter MnhA subunit